MNTKSSPLIGELLEAAVVNNQALMVSGAARVLAEKSIAAAHAAETARRRWRFFEAWRLTGRAQAFLEASQRVFNLSRSL